MGVSKHSETLILADHLSRYSLRIWYRPVEPQGRRSHNISQSWPLLTLTAFILTTPKFDLGAYTTYYLGTLFVKLSILLFYLRINPERTFRILTYTIGAFELSYILISIFIAILGCSPIERSWNFYIPGECVNKEAYFYAQAVFNIVTDFATLLLPIKLCIRLQLPRRQKWMLGLTFAVGSLYVPSFLPPAFRHLLILSPLTTLLSLLVTAVHASSPSSVS